MSWTENVWHIFTGYQWFCVHYDRPFHPLSNFTFAWAFWWSYYVPFCLQSGMHHSTVSKTQLIYMYMYVHYWAEQYVTLYKHKPPIHHKHWFYITWVQSSMAPTQILIACATSNMRNNWTCRTRLPIRNSRLLNAYLLAIAQWHHKPEVLTIWNLCALKVPRTIEMTSHIENVQAPITLLA